MKICGFYTKSVTCYDDDQISIPIAETNCVNIGRLVEHATMSPFYSLEEFARLYRALGHEYGIGHLNSTETILVLNLFDMKLAERLSAMSKSDDSPQTYKVIEDEWLKIRHLFIVAELEASIKRKSRKYSQISPCEAVKPFEFPKPF